ncbi:uncharacterized protein AB675_6273 [Cyphellophora attinorum]|uniref:Uncharacterized protein n=1 Tax=Cyphellophora attinorum TaxID=1664694 RepID=A0A0N1HZA3_9EURO|nr:uncharacterized protein AB675_6273 [Phialophora attinorum]KPI44060.1 hypothetical protein AB675_6273 [Phialophora attinorum]
MELCTLKELEIVEKMENLRNNPTQILKNIEALKKIGAQLPVPGDSGYHSLDESTFVNNERGRPLDPKLANSQTMSIDKSPDPYMDGPPAVQPPQRQRGLSSDESTAGKSPNNSEGESDRTDESQDPYKDGPPAVQPLHRQRGISPVRPTAGKSIKKAEGEPDRKRKRVIT